MYALFRIRPVQAWNSAKIIYMKINEHKASVRKLFAMFTDGVGIQGNNFGWEKK